MLISETMLPEAEKTDNVSIIGSPASMKFDSRDNLASVL
jgi:hypothetical protein